MENLKKQRKKYIIISILIATAIVVAMTVVVGYTVCFNITQTDILEEEIANLSSISSVKEIDMTIKTKGDYAILEKMIKDYYNETLTVSEEITELSTDERIAKIFTQENYDADGPKYTETIKYLSETKEKMNELMKKLIELSDENHLMNLLNNSGLNPLVIAAYQSEMYSNINTELAGVNERMVLQKELISNMIDAMIDTFEFLAENSDVWQMHNGQIYFSNETAQNEFIEIYEVMLEYAESM